MFLEGNTGLYHHVVMVEKDFWNNIYKILNVKKMINELNRIKFKDFSSEGISKRVKNEEN